MKFVGYPIWFPRQDAKKLLRLVQSFFDLAYDRSYPVGVLGRPGSQPFRRRENCFPPGNSLALLSTQSNMYSPDRSTFSEAAARLRFGCLAIVWVTVTFSPVKAGELRNLFAGPTKLLCKYSVRDVGFVNVHSFGWQITLAKPDNLSPDQFRKLDQEIRQQLEQTNVHHLWVDKKSTEWKKKISRVLNEHKGAKGISSESTWGILSNTEGESFTCLNSRPSAESLIESAKTLGRVIESAFRTQLLEACSETLCCIVLVECGNRGSDDQAKQMLDSAVRQLKKQMWELEKPTARPPVSLVLKYDQQTSEKWFLKTSGFVQNGADRNLSDSNASRAEPQFAIFYGQGRRLGGWIPWSKANVGKLVGRAAICGGGLRM